MGLGNLGCLYYLFISSTFFSICNILHHCSRKQSYRLGDQRDRRTKALYPQILDIIPVQKNIPGRWIIESQQQPNDCGLTAPSEPNDGLCSTWFDLQAKTRDHLFAFRIGKINILKVDSALYFIYVKFLLTFNNLYLGLKKIKDPNSGYHRSLIEIEGLTQSC